MKLPIRYRLRPAEIDTWGGQVEKSVAVQARYAASPPTKRFNGSFMLEIYEKDNPIPHHDGSRSDRH